MLEKVRSIHEIPVIYNNVHWLGKDQPCKTIFKILVESSFLFQ